METGETEGNVEDFPGVLKKEVTNPRKDTPFVVLISLLATLALARALVLLSALSFRSFRVATQEDLRWLVGRRPRGIAILAALQVLASVALLVGGLVLVVAASLPPSVDVQGEAAAFALGAVLILLGVLSLIVAWGLWTLQPWARKVAILFAIVSLGTDVVSILTGNYGNAVALLFDLLLIWYLTRPGVRAAFVRVDRSAQGTQESN